MPNRSANCHKDGEEKHAAAGYNLLSSCFPDSFLLMRVAVVTYRQLPTPSEGLTYLRCGVSPNHAKNRLFTSVACSESCAS
jgi:hypothetical protein